jgi:TetR/AcrR family transcriptional regulator
LLLGLVEGRLSQYVRSDFLRMPTENWDGEWLIIRSGLF